MQKLILPVWVVEGRENVSVPNPHPTSFTLLLFLESKSDMTPVFPAESFEASCCLGVCVCVAHRQLCDVAHKAQRDLLLLPVLQFSLVYCTCARP